MTKGTGTNRVAHWIEVASLTMLCLALAAAACKQTTQIVLGFLSSAARWSDWSFCGCHLSRLQS